MTDTNSVYIGGDFSNILHFGDSVSSIISSINSNEMEFDLTIYPNPATEQITISSEAIITEFTLYDLTGHIIMTKKLFTKEFILTTDVLKDGIYMISIKDNLQNNFTKKVLIQKDKKD